MRDPTAEAVRGEVPRRAGMATQRMLLSLLLREHSVVVVAGLPNVSEVVSANDFF